MCGIAGAVSKSNLRDLGELVNRIVKDQQIRGPDQQSVEQLASGSEERVFLGHDRLSIIDLSAAANQPMYSENRQTVVVFNGAIYNFKELREELETLGCKFRTSSDTEVLVQAYEMWGTGAFERFFGMFAIGIVDLAKKQLILARDRFGVKPLYYFNDNETIVFASTPSVISQWAELRPNLEYVGRGIKLKYYEDETEFSPFLGLSSLSPGTFLVTEFGEKKLKLTHRRYYDLQKNVAANSERIRGRSEEENLLELVDLLKNACSIRLRADVPLGISISGGVDSTSISALCGTSDVNIQGYSFGSPDDESSEARLAELAARRANMQVHYISQNSGATAEDLFWKTFRAQMLPFPHTSQMAQYAVFEKARTDQVKVLLGGQGGDEAFMGYRKFFLFQLANILQTKNLSSAPWMLRNILTLLPAVLSKAQIFWREKARYSGSQDGMGSDLILSPLRNSPSPGSGMGGNPDDRQILDVTRYSLPSLLRYEDRNSMGNSIESRLPFLDHRLVEFGIALPIQQKLNRGMGKYLLRKAMQDYVPNEILYNRDKRGFDTRHGQWIDDGVGKTIRDGLHAHHHVVTEYLSRDVSIDSLFSDQQLAQKPQRFAEATSLLWLADPSLKTYN